MSRPWLDGAGGIVAIGRSQHPRHADAVNRPRRLLLRGAATASFPVDFDGGAVAVFSVENAVQQAQIIVLDFYGNGCPRIYYRNSITGTPSSNSAQAATGLRGQALLPVPQESIHVPSPVLLPQQTKCHRLWGRHHTREG